MPTPPDQGHKAAFDPKSYHKAALVVGVLVPVSFHLYRRRKLATQTAALIEMQSTIHDLSIETKQLEIEEAKARGDFDRWKK